MHGTARLATAAIEPIQTESYRAMEALGKRKRGSDDAAAAATAGGGGDRLSALPDHLLHEIMSHMKARQMVRTCVLSRRWRRLWPSVPRLDIDQDEFGAADGAGHDKFDDFVNFLLERVSIALLDAFRLHVNNNSYASDYVRKCASAWIRRAIKASAQQPTQGPSSGSWRLKRLHLSSVPLDDHFPEHVRSRCPSLEELELSSCTCRFRAIASGSLQSLALIRCEGIGFSEIASPTLKSLAIDRGSNDIASPFVVAAPALADLFLVVSPYNFFRDGISLDEMPALAKASIHGRERETLVKSKHLRDHLFKILCRVSSATSLELISLDMTVQGEESMVFPEFSNLRNLELHQCGLGDDLQVSGHIIRNSPNLEKLILSPTCWKVLDGRSISKYPEFKNMRVLILDNYDPSDVLHTLGRFLTSSPLLEKLTLRCSKVSNNTNKKKGRAAKVMNTQNLGNFRCEKLKLTEIIYKDDDVRQLVELLLRFSGNLPNNNIRLTKV